MNLTQVLHVQCIGMFPSLYTSISLYLNKTLSFFVELLYSSLSLLSRNIANVFCTHKSARKRYRLATTHQHMDHRGNGSPVETTLLINEHTTMSSSPSLGGGP